jgi:aspartate carbamoyltransferase catalytic subunit
MTKYKKPELMHFTSLDTLTSDDIFYLIHKAREFCKTAIDAKKVLPILTGRVITTLFFEPSTRTLNSFLLSAKRLNALTLSPNLAYCSTLKGESLIDTVQTFEAMGTDLFVIRHSDNHIPDFISNELQTNARVINAGDGTNRHPTQALLDLMTIYEHKSDFTKLSVAIVGDINHSRVAHSLVVALKKVGVPDIRLVGPESLLDTTQKSDGVSISYSLSDGLKNCDVVISLRVQEERFTKNEHIDITHYKENYCINKSILNHAHEDVIVMHPGPINRNVEISSEVADSTRSTIREQVKNGVAMRMAILDTLLTNN